MVSNLTLAACDDAKYELVKQLLYFVPLTYGIPTVILYLNIVAVIFSRRERAIKAAFFKIYAVSSLVMVVEWCWDMTTTRFIAIGYFCRELLSFWGDPNYVLAPVQFVMTYTRHASFYAATIISINRMTAVLWPTSAVLASLFLSMHVLYTAYRCGLDLGKTPFAYFVFNICSALVDIVVSAPDESFSVSLFTGRINHSIREVSAKPLGKSCFCQIKKDL
ncbi:hypothetical protein ANCCEY_06973 [Ancylostoma ceylanicum]|uniref:Serpentine receptor class gamma n=1 Tax=Ancylostoma ceylanicum TaxID=53326 RepID=A0A0D6LQ18_9BILA|nr:hypothetical protein ANCCEY_06973 [Ancylostoma ceylanicum]